MNVSTVVKGSTVLVSYPNRDHQQLNQQQKEMRVVVEWVGLYLGELLYNQFFLVFSSYH